jgi:type IV pilus assembly protein PilX
MNPIELLPNDRRLHACRRRREQAGGALVAVLLMLLVTLIMAMGSLRTANLEERMAGNVRDRQTAFQLAEATLRDAEQAITSSNAEPFKPLRPAAFGSTCTAGLCRSSQDSARWPGLSEADWNSSKTLAFGALTGTPLPAGATTAPRVVIEYQGTIQPIEPGKPCVGMFLLTARARGANDATDVVLQSVFRHRVGECYDAV